MRVTFENETGVTTPADNSTLDIFERSRGIGFEQFEVWVIKERSYGVIDYSRLDVRVERRNVCNWIREFANRTLGYIAL